MQNDAVMKNKIDYIHSNPVEHGYVDEANIGAAAVQEILKRKRPFDLRR